MRKCHARFRLGEWWEACREDVHGNDVFYLIHVVREYRLGSALMVDVLYSDGRFQREVNADFVSYDAFYRRL